MIIHHHCCNCISCHPVDDKSWGEKHRDLIPEGVKLVKMTNFESSCPPPIPEETKVCEFCDVFCGNDYCCMKDEK